MDRTELVRTREFVPVRTRHSVRFVGREVELATVSELLDGRRRSHPGRGLVIEGEAGIGKSRLVTEALDRVPGLAVLRGAADPLGRHHAFGAVTAALGHLDPSAYAADAELMELLGDRVAGRPPVGPGLRARLIDACVAAVAARAVERRAVLVLEDLHWADDGTVAVFAELCEAVPRREVVAIATRRRVPRPDQMRQLEAARGRQVEVLEVGALHDHEVVELVTERIGRPAAPELVAQVARAGGNPLYVTELVDALAEQGSLVAEPGPDRPAQVQHASLPPDLRMTLLRRLSTLPDAAIEALRVASLLGTSFLVADLASGLDEPVPRAVARLDQPLRAGWLTEDGDRLRFRHDLVRAAVHDDVAAAIRRGLHRHLADRLASAGRDPNEVAHHLVLGASPPDPEAAAWLREAGARASAREPRVAVDLLEAAVTLDPTPGPTRDGTELELAVARCWAGQARAGEQLLRELLGRPHDPSIDAAASLALARSSILAGDTQEARHILTAAAARAGDERERTRLVAEIAICALLRGDLPGAAAAIDEVLAAADVTDESRCVAYAFRAPLLALEGRMPSAIAAGRTAVEIAAHSGEVETARRPPQLLLASVLLDTDAFEEGWRLLDEGRRVCEAMGTVWDLPLVHVVAARGRYLAGEHDDSLAEAETALTAAAEVGTFVLEVWAHALVAHVHLHRTDHEAARAALEAGEAVVTRVGFEVRGVDWLVWARARLLELDGDHEMARQLLMAVWDGYDERGIRSERRLLGPELARAHLRAGDLRGARAVAEGVEELAELAGTPSTAAAALHVRGLVEGDAARLVAAATGSGQGPCRTEHVAQALDAADQLLVDGRRRDAGAWFEAAHVAASAGGMTRSVRRAEAALRGLGVHRGVRGGRTRPAVGWSALTPTEWTVTELAARGLSNPEIGAQLFISRRTVQTHLSHVYAKLGVSSRVELATQVAHRGRSS